MMVPKKSLLCTGLALAGFALSANAQTAEPLDGRTFKRVKSVKHMVYDFENRRVIRNGTPQKNALATFCYVNTDFQPVFTSTQANNTEEGIDWGIVGGTASTTCGFGVNEISPIATNFTFGYATSATDTSVAGPGAALTLRFYTGYCGFGADSGLAPVAEFAFTGLPGFSGTSTGIGSGYFITSDVSGGLEFCMPTGKMGFGYTSPEDDGVGFALSGPIVADTGDGLGGPEPLTGNIDAIDFWAPDTSGVSTGTVFFGGPPSNFTSWYLSIARADLQDPATVATRNAAPNKPSSLACAPAVLAGTLQITALANPGYVAMFLIAFDSPFSFPLGGGQILLCLDLGGSGELLSGAGVTATPAGTNGGCPQFTYTSPLPKNVDLCGFGFCVQGLMAFGVVPFGLTSACDMVLGG